MSILTICLKGTYKGGKRMSTRTIYICDRCGKEYNYQGETVGFHITQPLRDGTQEQLDLCPGCQKLLNDIMHDPYDPYEALEKFQTRQNSIPIGDLADIDDICYKLTGQHFNEIRDLFRDFNEDELSEFRVHNAIETLAPTGSPYEPMQLIIHAIHEGFTEEYKGDNNG